MSDHRKTILITGGASGIGYAIARKYDAQGYRVIIADLDAAGGKQAAETLAHGLFIQTDASDKAAIDAMVEQAYGLVDHVDILVNNAGVARHMKSFDIPADNWESCISLMLSGVFYCTQAIGRKMAAAHGGNIINIASMNGSISLPGRLVYSCCKAAVLSMTKTLAAEWAPNRIRVNAVSPGVTLTKLAEKAMASGISNLDDYLSRIPLGRLAEPPEIADACYFLTSDEARYITGHNLVVDGGWTSYNWIDLPKETQPCPN